MRNSGLLTGARTRLLSADKKPCRRIHPMQKSAADLDVADAAPTAPILTDYDEQHLVTYLRLLDAAADGSDWKEVARTVLHIDVAREPDRARRAWETHLARARWITEHGYRDLLRGGAPH
ncbi:DUF2285 domain-containing protein [Bradyrhizobium barranii]|uniref:DUF2285 domain-containing protein n=1 Tax=Bradyrhizobium barranii subsp. barranii TaxID=2823807 RepID=A0A9X9YDI0_9BRAD|nr:DUF2285 domain-containing protein [Bradyrhizobium barranii subsp. barranii]